MFGVFGIFFDFWNLDSHFDQDFLHFLRPETLLNVLKTTTKGRSRGGDSTHMYSMYPCVCLTLK